MQHLADWINYGKRADSSRRTVRRWLNEARGHVPIIDRVNN